MLKELGEKLEVGMRGTIVLCVLIAGTALATLGAYIAVATCARVGQLLHRLVFGHSW